MNVVKLISNSGNECYIMVVGDLATDENLLSKLCDCRVGDEFNRSRPFKECEILDDEFNLNEKLGRLNSATKLKYVSYFGQNDDSDELKYTAIIFPEIYTHSIMHGFIRHTLLGDESNSRVVHSQTKPFGAGFINLSEGKLVPNGYSISLGVSVAKDDDFNNINAHLEKYRGKEK